MSTGTVPMGGTAVEVLSAILRDHPEVTGLNLLKIGGHPDPTPLQTRIGDTTSVDHLLASGKRIREDTGLSFFDAVLVSCFGAGIVAYPIVDNVSFHNPKPPPMFIPRHQQVAQSFGL